MEDTPMEIIGIMLSAILMFLVPLFLIADRSDDISQLVAQSATSDFVNEIIQQGKITSENYDRFTSTLYSSGNTYEVDMEVKILDETTSKNGTTWSTVGDNAYYSLYTSQVLNKLTAVDANNRTGKLILKQGDQVSVTVRNNSKTLSQSLKNFYYNTTGEDVHIIAASSSGTVSINGFSGTI